MKVHPVPFVALLGPGEPELTCHASFELLDVSAELGACADAATPGMRPHLRGCPTCHEDPRGPARTWWPT